MATNGTVTSYSASTGRAAAVHFDGPPPSDPVYTNLDADKWQVFRDALINGLKVDVTTDENGVCTGVTAHK